MLLLVVFLLSGVLRGASEEESVHTYKHGVLICDRCPPGTFMKAHCTATTPTQCTPCKHDHFTALWNYLPKCLYCRTFCSENQDVERECSPVSDRVCRCKEGFYWNGYFCARHTKCGPGHGVQTKGTSAINTVCEKCPEGYFSNSLSALEPCVKHQECAGNQSMLLPGTAYHDTLCRSCDDLYGDDDSETLRTLILAFFSAQKMNVIKMKKFVTRYINKPSIKERDHLMDHIREWLAQAPEEELRKVPQMLKASKLNSMAGKLDRRLRWIHKQRINCIQYQTATD